MNMATGMFRTDDGSVQVDYDGNNIPIPRSKYEENGYKPAFDELPLEEDYWAAQEKAKSSEAKNTITVNKMSVLLFPGQLAADQSVLWKPSSS
jgi:hypothetical protein